MREIVLDTETTGLDPKTGHRVVEIGCVEMVNRFLTGKTFHEYINPERSMPPDAFAIHGLSDGFLKDKPIFASIADSFVDFIGDAKLVIHNASFDIMFLNYELNKLGKPIITSDRVVDTLMLARRKHPGQPNSLDALCARYGIDNSRRTKHGALLDSEILAEVYGELTGGRQQTLGLASAPTARSGGAVTSAARRQREPLEPLLTAEEKSAHARFIEGMGEKALWRKYLGLTEP
ncbi:MAG: DNA polymerase III subunit epsilon [Proteobacteria bacterium]|nr:DNA polymerase III subunit epsilon [Pseudomonadota bacterium]